MSLPDLWKYPVFCTNEILKKHFEINRAVADSKSFATPVGRIRNMDVLRDRQNCFYEILKIYSVTITVKRGMRCVEYDPVFFENSAISSASMKLA